MAAAGPRPAAACPVCQDITLHKHCASPTCSWHRCRNKKCAATLDLAARRGYLITDRKGASRAFPLTA